MTVPDIIERYEIPQEYHEAIWEAYQECIKRGFIDANLALINVDRRNHEQTEANRISR